MDFSKKNFVEDFKNYAKRVHGKGAENLSVREAYETLCHMVTSVAKQKKSEVAKECFENKKK